MKERANAVLTQLAMRGWSQFALAVLAFTVVTVMVIAAAVAVFLIWVAISVLVGPIVSAFGMLLVGAVLVIAWLESETMPTDPRKKKE